MAKKTRREEGRHRIVLALDGIRERGTTLEHSSESGKGSNG